MSANNYNASATGNADDVFSNDFTLATQGHIPPAASTGSAIPTAQQVQNILHNASKTVSLKEQSSIHNADANSPAFLHGFTFNKVLGTIWYQIVLAYIPLLTFVVESTSVMFFLVDMLKSEELPELYLAISKIEFPGWYWFSGVADNRRHNPYFQLASQLPNLLEIGFTIHPAGITTSRFDEDEMEELEQSDPVQAKERRVLRLNEITTKYEIKGLFNCPNVQKVHLKWIESDITEFYTKEGDIETSLVELQMHIIDGFSRLGRAVTVDLQRIVLEKHDDA